MIYSGLNAAWLGETNLWTASANPSKAVGPTSFFQGTDPPLLQAGALREQSVGSGEWAFPVEVGGLFGLTPTRASPLGGTNKGQECWSDLPGSDLPSTPGLSGLGDPEVSSTRNQSAAI